ncbi:MAG: methyltransferase domain-containing protein [Patescibacteria group bacterium]|nr:methyltransferase domain-containing protein [Patescibacteria group bacterium]MDE2232657.1 methyltransferase domain-containing protein [Patescibacteria group bacterium]
MFSDPASNLAKFGLTEGMKVVDLGAGSGFYAVEAARRVGASGRVYAVEVQKDLLDRIRSNGAAEGLHNIEVVWGDAEKIGGTKLREALADRVIVSNILFQAEKPDELALEVKRLLKPGGKALVVDWSELSPIGPGNIFPAAKAQTLFEKSGFKLEQSFGAGEHHYGLVFTR